MIKLDSDFEEEIILRTRKNKYSVHSEEDVDRILKLLEENEHIHLSIKNNYELNPIIPKTSNLQEIDPINGHYAISNDWSHNIKSGGLHFLNKTINSNQRKVVTYMLKKIGKNLIQGKSLMSVSFPIDIFDTTTFLQRIASQFTYAPYFLEKNFEVVEKDLPLIQFKAVVGFMISTLHLGISQLKPFNPILGFFYLFKSFLIS